MHVFLSYASEDRALATEVALALNGAGHEAWYDHEDLHPGDDFRANLRKAVRDSDAFVFLASPHSVADGCFALSEMEHAREKWPHPAGRVITVRLGALPIEDIPVYLRSVTLLQQAGTGDLPTEVVRAVEALKPGRWSRPLLAAGVTVLLVAAALLARNRISGRELDQLSDRALHLTPVESLAARPLRQDADRVKVHARMIQFLAIAARRPVPLASCDGPEARRQATDLANRTDVRAAVQFLRGASPLLATATGLSLDSTNLQGLSFKGASLRAVRFVEACVDSTEFRDAALEGATFDRAHGENTVFTRARLEGARFVEAQLPAASFYGACLRRADFTGAGLEGANFRATDLAWASFQLARLAESEGWADDDPTPSPLFLGAQGLTASDSAALRARGGVFSGDYASWSDQRAAASAGTSRVPACQALAR